MNSKSKQCPLSANMAFGKPFSYQVFVGGLSLEATEDELLSQFTLEFGRIVDARIMKFRDGRSRGFGFVQFLTREQYEMALEVRQIWVHGHPVECRPSMTPEEAAYGAKELLKRKLILYGISNSVSEQHVASYFQGFGPVVRTKFFKNSKNIFGFGQGYIEFEDQTSAGQFIQNIHYPKIIEIAQQPLLVYSAEAKSSNTKAWKDSFKAKFARRDTLVTRFTSSKTITRSQATTDEQSFPNSRSISPVKMSAQFQSEKTIQVQSRFRGESMTVDENIRLNVPISGAGCTSSIRIGNQTHVVMLCARRNRISNFKPTATWNFLRQSA